MSILGIYLLGIVDKLKEPIAQYIVSQSQIRHTLSAESAINIRRMPSAGLDSNIFVQKYMIELPSEEEIKKFISEASY